MTFRAPFGADGRALVFAGEAAVLELELQAADGLAQDLSGRAFVLQISDGLDPALAIAGAAVVDGAESFVRFGLLGEHTEDLLGAGDPARDLTYQVIEIGEDGDDVLLEALFQARRRGRSETPVTPGDVAGPTARFVVNPARRRRLAVRYVGAPGRGPEWSLYVNGVISEPTFAKFLEWFNTGAGDATSNALTILRGGVAAEADTLAKLLTLIRGNVPDNRNSLKKLSDAVNSNRDAAIARNERRGVDPTDRGIVFGAGLTTQQRTSNRNILRSILQTERALFHPGGTIEIAGDALPIVSTGPVSIIGAPGKDCEIVAYFGGYILNVSGVCPKLTIHDVRVGHGRRPADTPPGNGVGTNSNLEVDEDGQPVVVRGWSGGVLRGHVGVIDLDGFEIGETFGPEYPADEGGGGAIQWLGQVDDGGSVRRWRGRPSPSATGCGGIRVDMRGVDLSDLIVDAGDDGVVFTLGEGDVEKGAAGLEGVVRDTQYDGFRTSSEKARDLSVGIGMQSAGSIVETIVWRRGKLFGKRAKWASDSARLGVEMYRWRGPGPGGSTAERGVGVTLKLGRHGAELRNTAIGEFEDIFDLGSASVPAWNGLATFATRKFDLATGKRTGFTIEAIDVGAYRYRIRQDPAELVSKPERAFDLVFAEAAFLVGDGGADSNLFLAMRNLGSGGARVWQVQDLAPAAIEMRLIANEAGDLIPPPLGAQDGKGGQGIGLDTRCFYLFDWDQIAAAAPALATPTPNVDLARARVKRRFPSHMRNCVLELCDERFSVEDSTDPADPAGAPRWTIYGPHENCRSEARVLGAPLRTYLNIGGGCTDMIFRRRATLPPVHDRPLIVYRDPRRAILGWDGPLPATAPLYEGTVGALFDDGSGEEDNPIDWGRPDKVTLEFYGQAVGPGSGPAGVDAVPGGELTTIGTLVPALGVTAARPIWKLPNGLERLVVRGFDFSPWLALPGATLEGLFINPAAVPVVLAADCIGAPAILPAGYSSQVAAAVQALVGAAPTGRRTLADLSVAIDALAAALGIVV